MSNGWVVANVSVVRDGCGVRVGDGGTGDVYSVTRRLGAVRAMTRSWGWTWRGEDDLCPACSTHEVPVAVAAR